MSDRRLKQFEAVGVTIMFIFSLSLIAWNIFYKSMSIVLPIAVLFFAVMWLFDLFETWISKDDIKKNEKQ